MVSIEPILTKSRKAAEVVKSKKHSDRALYLVLVDCMQITEICHADNRELIRLNQRITALPLLPGHKRQYIEKASDVYQRVCRCVFHGIEHTQNINRYAIALREAARIGKTSGDLMEQLMKGGGIHRLWLRRYKTATMVRTRTLYLQRQIEHIKYAEFSMTFKLRKDGTYQVTDLDGVRFGMV